MSEKDGGSAFPYQHDHVLYHADDPTKPAQTIHGVWTGGMTLRDYFAAKAMQGWLASFTETRHPALIGANESDEVRDRRLTSFAYMSYLVADAMLKAREA